MNKKEGRQTNIMRVGKMKSYDLKSMSTEELWSLHERVTSVLERKISAEKGRLEQRLRQLGQGVLTSDEHVSSVRRPYPKVVPKFRNPKRPSETWAGRGKRPLWLTAELRSGKKIDDFRIKLPGQGRRHAH
jgi:DNA-binding protein H-NS